MAKEQIELKQVILIAVIALIILVFYYILKGDQEAQQDVMDMCAIFIENTDKLPKELKTNPIVKRCLKKLKKPQAEPFGYGFGLYNEQDPYTTAYQRSEWIQGPSPYPQLKYTCSCGL
jgi:hypothetical protein